MWNGEALKGLCISRFMDGFLFELFDAGLLVLEWLWFDLVMALDG